ncbi:methyl-accepting chemotaxis protein, partial [Reinekea sp.]|jgi:methyl-accepting chemotaxis protein
VGLLMAVSSFMTFSLLNDFRHGFDRVSTAYTPAISSVLNADRDLYQARVAELNALLNYTNKDSLANELAEYKENAQQAYDRMYVLLGLLEADKDIAAKVSGFEGAFETWLNTSQQVFDLLGQGNLEAAKNLSDGASISTFGILRDFYDIAGVAADANSALLAEQLSTRVEIGSSFLFIVTAVVVLAILGMGIYAPRAMSLALYQLRDSLSVLNSGNGDLSQRITSNRKDEIGEVANEVNHLMEGLTELIKGIVDQSTIMIDEVKQMAEGAQQVQNTSNEQQESVDMAVTAVNELSVAIREVAQNAQLAAGEINEVNKLTADGKLLTESSLNQIQGLSDTVSEASATVSELAESSQKIASVLDVIRGIAEQTNLLALNAAIEAARAGEQGRGFAVVADEVRSLASKTQQSTDDIQTMIEMLQSGVNNAVNAIEKGNVAAEKTVAESAKMLESLINIDSASARVSDASMQIATSTEEQSHVAEEVNATLVRLSDLATHNAEQAAENGSVSLEVREVAEALNKSVSRFKLS